MVGDEACHDASPSVLVAADGPPATAEAPPQVVAMLAQLGAHVASLDRRMNSEVAHLGRRLDALIGCLERAGANGNPVTGQLSNHS